jgi:hypothetical protein
VNDRCAVADADCTPDSGGPKEIRRGMCDVHYERWWRHGDTRDITLDPRPQVAGELNPNHKLTWAGVAKMRELRAEGWTIPDLAKRFGTSTSNAHLIVRGRTWRTEPAAWRRQPPKRLGP